MKVNIGLAKRDLELSIENLTTVLSNEMVLYVKTRKFHWNVSGNSFMELHKLFENQYNELEETIDEVAERISELGDKAIGTMKEFLEHATLVESSGFDNQKQMLRELLEDHETIISETREIVENMEKESKDYGTIDFLTSLMLSHESKAWILRKYTA